MNYSNIYIMLLSCLLLAACSHEEDPSPDPGGEDVPVTVSVTVDGGDVTKGVMNTYTENWINNMTVVFIDKQTNEVIGHGYTDISGMGKGTSDSISLKTGTYRMLVLANTGDISSFKATDYYDYVTAEFFQPDDMAVIFGCPMSYADENITISKKTAISVWIKRVVSRIDLTRLSVHWNDSDLRGIEGLQFRLKSVFVANVRQRTYLFDTREWSMNGVPTHPMEYADDTYYCGIDDLSLIAKGEEIAEGNVNESVLDYPFMNSAMGRVYDENPPLIGNDESMAVEDVFYVTSNSHTKDDLAPVILYIKGDLYDSKNAKNVLTDRYYRIKLEKGVQSNTVYRIEARITGKGSSVPGINQENTDLSAILERQTWQGEVLDRINIDYDIDL